jgi:hypothetical protein
VGPKPSKYFRIENRKNNAGSSSDLRPSIWAAAWPAVDAEKFLEAWESLD